MLLNVIIFFINIMCYDFKLPIKFISFAFVFHKFYALWFFNPFVVADVLCICILKA